MLDKTLTQPSSDPISGILKWILLLVAILCLGLLGWATVLTYEKAPPHPQAVTDGAGHTIMTADGDLAPAAGLSRRR